MFKRLKSMRSRIGNRNWIYICLFFIWGLPIFLRFSCMVGIEAPGVLVALNVMEVMLAAGSLLFFTEKPKVVLLLLYIPAFLLSVFESFLTDIRGMCLQPADIYSFKTALSVADGYLGSIKEAFVFPSIFLLPILIFILLFVPFDLKVRIDAGKRKLVGVASLVLLVLSFLFITQSQLLSDYEEMYDKRLQASKMGVVTSFLYDLKDLRVSEPEGYSEKRAMEILDRYEVSSVESNEKPDVVVIMDEALSDVSVLCNELPFDNSYIPFVRSVLGGNLPATEYGYLDVSVIGGNTVNTEWEFLTGNSMRFTTGVPFQQWITDDTDLSYALPSLFNDAGYRTIAMHPYNAGGYRRNTVYQKFGFDEMIFQDDFVHQELVREFVSDEAVFSEVKDHLEDGEDPKFIFAVTMQNHAWYQETEGCAQDFTFEDPEVFVEGDESLNTYLTLENITDAALEEFIRWCDERKSPTIIVFFGDHEPAPVVTSAIADTEDAKDYYKVPYLMHANFPVSSGNKDTSPNFLGLRVLDLANVTGTAYQEFLKDVHAQYDSVSVFVPEEIVGETLEEYRVIQHYQMFANKNFRQ